MLTRPLIAFDIETIPDPDFGRRVMGFEGDNAAVIETMTTRGLGETDGKSPNGGSNCPGTCWFNHPPAHD